MKRFYLAIVFFVLPIFVLMGGAEFAVRQIPNEYKYKNDWMEQHAEKVETLVLGNSHTAEGLNPSLFGKESFSLAIPGQSYLFCHYLFFKWADRYQHLKVVIMPVSYSSFYETDDPVNTDISHLYYGVYMDCPYHKYEIKYNLETLYYKPFTKKIANYFSNNYISWTSNGWIPWLLVNKSRVWNAEHVNKSLARMYYARSYSDVRRNIEHVEKIADYCHHHGIRLVLVSTPQTKEYNSCLCQKQIFHTDSVVQIVQRKHGADYYDYREDVRFESDDFFDQSHLSEVGAEKFTKILFSDLKQQ